MRIMLCDDDAEDLMNMKRRVDRYWQKRNLPVPEIRVTQSSADLIRWVQDGDFYDIYLLDIVMAEGDGISVAKTIRKTGRKSVIIYATSSADFALRAFGVFATGYLLKPVEEEAFDGCMDVALSKLMPRQDITISVKCRDGFVNVNAGRLMLVQNTSRVMRIHMKDGEIIESVYIRQPFEEELKELLADPRFIQPHKSFVINLEYVDKLMARDFVMRDGTVVPISRSNLAATKRRYLEYLSKTE